MQLRAPHADSGVVLSDRGHGLLPLHYGDADAEYRALREGAGVAELAERALLVVTGPLRQKFLHGLLSNDVAGLSPGQARGAALLDVKGRMLAVLRVLACADEVVLELPEARLARVEALLTHYRVGAPVRFATRPAAVLLLAGPKAGRVLATAGGAEPPADEDTHSTLELAGAAVRVARARDVPGGGWIVHTEPDAAERVWRVLLDAGARAVGREALDARRVEEGRPWYGFDVDEDNLLHETGLLRELHSPTKGCYVGQEVVARLEGRGGRVNKALRGLSLTAPSAPGTPIHAGDREIGRLTSCARSPRHGEIALGYVHRDHFEPGATVEVEGREARVCDLPFAEGPV